MDNFNSKEYWENRYKSGGNSGAGSRNNLAEFKINTINKFIRDNKIKSIIDCGSGDGFIAGELIVKTYTGFDVSITAVENCNKMFESDISKVFTTKWSDDFKADLSISMDVIFHLIEDSVYEEYVRRLFLCAEKYVIIYSSNCTSKNMSEHYKDRQVIEYIKNNVNGWRLIETIQNPLPFTNDAENESNSDFYIYKRSQNET